MAANAEAICDSFKSEVLSGVHALGTTVIRAGTTKDTIKGALFTINQSLGKATTAYNSTGEVAASGDYSAGGSIVTNANNPSLDGDTAIWTPSASLAWHGVTFAAFDTLLIYNSTQSNKAIEVLTFGQQQITSGDFTITMPTNAAATALLQLA